MYYCNDFYKLSVLSLYEGELIGVVDKLYFDKKLKKLIQLELIGNNDTRYILQSKNIYRIGKNAITVKNNQVIMLKVEDTPLTNCPIDSKAYTIKGEYLGIIKEITLNEKFLTQKFSLDNNSTLPINNVASCGKNTVIFYDTNDRININKFTPSKSPKSFKSPKGKKTEILPITSNPEPTHAELVGVQKPIIQNSDFLLGRICTKDIFNFNNELLIKAHTVVTQKNLKEINKFGKLRELMLYTK